MKFLLINLDRSPDRLAFMEGQAQRCGFEFERVPGVDGAACVPAAFRDQFIDAPLSNGEIGCYASHLVCAQTIVDRGWPFAVILEDDVTLDDDFATAAANAVASAPPGWDDIHLSSNVKRSVVRVADMGRRSLVTPTRLPVNTAAYIFSNAGARKFLAARPRIRPNDIDIRYAWIMGLNVYSVFPSPAAQMNNFESDIGGTHHPGHKTPRGQWSPGIASLAYGALWNLRRLGIVTSLKARIFNIVSSASRKVDGKRRIKVL
jgi:glycosyl transferase family 25